MIFFFHHYELPALLEQIRQQQHQHQQAPPHRDQQAANDHPGPENNVHPTDDPDQSDSGQPSVDTEVEPQDADATDDTDADHVTADMDNRSNQLSSVDRTIQGHLANVVQRSLQQPQASCGFGFGFVAKTTHQSAALTQPTSMSSSFHSSALTSDTDSDYGCSAVDTEETRVHRSDLPSSSSHETTDGLPTDAADDESFASLPAVDSSTELRRRHQVSSDSTSPSSSYRAFTSHQELYTNRPTGDRTVVSAETLTVSGSSPAQLQQHDCNSLSTNASHTE